MQITKYAVVGLVVFIGLLLVPSSVFAVSITEIMYDPPGADSGREWIEVYNNTGSAVDITALRLFENNVAHKITAHDGGDVFLPAGMWAVIADNSDKFMLDYPEYTGPLFDSVFSLSNTGETLEMRDASGTVLDSVTYTSSLGAKGDGLSLQLHEGVFIPATPTPGAQNKTQPEDVTPEPKETNTTTTSGTQSSTHSSQVALSTVKDVSTMNVTAGRDRSALVHVPIAFSGIPQGGTIAQKTVFQWNFGDGYTARGKEISHMYTYPGVYNVVMYAISGANRAVARTKVTVQEPQLQWSVATSTIEIHNAGSSEINIGLFILKKGRSAFTVPQDTIVDAGRTLTLSKNIFPKTNATNTVEFLFPNKKPIPSVN